MHSCNCCENITVMLHTQLKTGRLNIPTANYKSLQTNRALMCDKNLIEDGNEFHREKSSMQGLHSPWVLFKFPSPLGNIGFYWVILGNNGFYWGTLGFCQNVYFLSYLKIQFFHYFQRNGDILPYNLYLRLKICLKWT